ncbi:MAG: RluA family pseudouridine synthase [bacterium]
MKEKKMFTITTNENLRLDIFLAHRMPEYSRSFFQRLIKDGKVLKNGKPCCSSHKVTQGDELSVEYSADGIILEPDTSIDLNIIHEDKDLIIVNKAPGMVVHPAAGNPTGTLANALAAHKGFINRNNKKDPLRPGIVHRLDKFTSGVMVVAKNDKAHYFLSRQFLNRKVKKIYLAIVHGTVQDAEAVIDVPLERDIHNRQKMAVHLAGRKAETYIKLKSTHGLYSLVEIRPKTGRTHQIRVHMQYYGCPIAGDTIYGGKKVDAQLTGLLIPRQMLHAWKLTITHPRSLKEVTYTVPVPSDFCSVWKRLSGGEQNDF